MEQQIEKHKPQLPALEPRSLEIFNVLDSALVKDISDVEIMPTLRKAMVTAYFEVGYSAPTQVDFDLMASGILRNIRIEFKHYSLRVNEIQIAFKRGILREFGDFAGLSIASFTYFIKMYLMGNSRLDALKEKHKPEEKKAPTPEQQRKDFIDRLNILFENYKNGLLIHIPEAVLYFNQLWKEKIIKFTDVIRAELKQQALKEMLAKVDFKTNDTVKRINAKAIYDEISKNGDQDERVMNYAKYLGLLKWFQFIKESGISLNETLEL